MLTKSDYIRYRQCKKYLWLNKKRKDLLPEVSAAKQAIFDQGYEVEKYAQSLFGEGKTTSNDVFKAEKETKEFIRDGTKVLFQATAIADQLLVRADIFQYDAATNCWDIYEVKSPMEVKEEHLFDLCFQKIVFEKAGFKIGKTFLIHINKDYVRKGEIKPHELLIFVDVSEKILNLENIILSDIPKALAVLEEQEEPHVKIIKQCTSPYECAFIDHCWKEAGIPNYSVYDLKRIGEKKLNDLLEIKVMEIKDIPDGFPLTETQTNQVAVTKTRQPIIDKENITSILRGLKYPIYWLDYETFASAIPLFDGISPYQQIPFQYSLHVLHENGKLNHFEFLAAGKENPISELLKQLRRNIASDSGTVMVWNKSFEMARNNEMSAMYPEYKEFLDGVNRRVFDLMEIFTKQYYVHPDFRGSCSIKKILPVLVPELSYKFLGIQDGGTATRNWYEMNFGHISTEERKIIYDNLLRYCGLDSFAMFCIFRKLQSVCGMATEYDKF